MPYSSIPLYWRLKKSKYNLIGSKCITCKSVFFPPRALCPQCRRRGKLEDFQFSGKGTILSHTIIRNPPEGFEGKGPYAVGIIELDGGARISGQIVDSPEKVTFGKMVKAVFRKVYEDGKGGLIHYGLKWKMVD